MKGAPHQVFFSYNTTMKIIIRYHTVITGLPLTVAVRLLTALLSPLFDKWRDLTTRAPQSLACEPFAAGAPTPLFRTGRFPWGDCLRQPPFLIIDSTCIGECPRVDV